MSNFFVWHSVIFRCIFSRRYSNLNCRKDTFLNIDSYKTSTSLNLTFPRQNVLNRKAVKSHYSQINWSPRNFAKSRGESSRFTRQAAKSLSSMLLRVDMVDCHDRKNDSSDLEGVQSLCDVWFCRNLVGSAVLERHVNLRQYCIRLKIMGK